MSAGFGSHPQTHLGSFPDVGPVTYLTDDPIECQRLMEGPPPSIRKWFHGTDERAARLACVQGIVPGCWIHAGGRCCGILGYDSLDEFLSRRNHLWIVEILGPARGGDVKAWWVPQSYIQGVWHGESFIPRESMAAQSCESPTALHSGCSCNLTEMCAQQQAIWRATWTMV